MMPKDLKIEWTLYERKQTTIPEAVRRMLRLSRGDRICFSIHADGEVTISRVPDAENADPAIAAFLTLLDNDMALHPERLQPMTIDILAAIKKLTDGVGEIDLNARLEQSPG